MAVLPKPAQTPEWATTGSKVEPSAGKKAAGWVLNEIPSSSFENWKEDLNNQWWKWIDERLEDGSTPDNLNIVTGQVGINKATPEGKLHVFGPINSSVIFETAQNGQQELILKPVAGQANQVVRLTRSAGDDVLFESQFVSYGLRGLGNKDFQIATNGRSDDIVIDATTGDVGLSQSTPLAPLHVLKSPTSYASAFANTVAVFERNLDSFIDIVTGTSNISGIRFSDTGSTTSGRFEYSHGFDRFQWWVQGAPRMKMLLGELSPWSAGFDLGSTTVPWGNVYADNVGIGIAGTPVVPLHVVGNIANYNPGLANLGSIAVRASDFGTSFRASELRYRGATFVGDVIAGIPGANTGELMFQNTNTALIGTNGGAPLVLFTSTIERMRIDGPTGFVGIGKPTPAVSLDIAGGVRARSGAPGANGINNNGYAFDGDSDSGMFSLSDGELSFHINSTSIIQMGNFGVYPSIGDSHDNGLSNRRWDQLWCRRAYCTAPNFTPISAADLTVRHAGNCILAWAEVSSTGTLLAGWNVFSVTWSGGGSYTLFLNVSEANSTAVIATPALSNTSVAAAANTGTIAVLITQSSSGAAVNAGFSIVAIGSPLGTP